MRAGRTGQAGFTYLAVIFMVAVVGIVLAANGMLWSAVKRSDDSEQLEFVGNQIKQAIGSYYEQSLDAKAFPKRLDDLLKDERTAVPRRHLRQIYCDPFTNKADWTLVVAPDGGVMGIASSSAALTHRREFIYQPFVPAGTSARP